ncbi:Major facilitator superfamily domain, general substrate transporter [Penicillium italicum]|uniref:Major facilitator superfamily domain, general substrate transporter n=1 Tax=Penicillium italicum TaxID=40296 RepID=A0A0A2KNE7_PENIT|nr:Major facilitator superfamily domain, general substrate transporter [Penicillium italicum]
MILLPVWDVSRAYFDERERDIGRNVPPGIHYWLAFGPIVFGPLSELYGRKKPLIIGFYIFAIFQIPAAVAQNLQTIFVCRFLGGLFASAPLAIVGCMLADLFGPVDRGIGVAISATSTFIGPVAGPIVGGFITMS